MLDRLRAVSYIGAGVLWAACPAPFVPLISTGLDPMGVSTAQAWAGRTIPGHGTAIRFRFAYRDPKRRWAGHGTVRLAPPDSLRFDYAGPLGLGSGAAIVVGDSVVWADPSANFHSLVPAIPMLWAALGIVRPPGAGAVVMGREAPPRTFWRFIEGGDTLDYVATEGTARLLEAEWRRGGKVQARCSTTFDDRAKPSKARIDIPEAPARFDLTVAAVDTAAVFGPTLWRNRR